MTRRSENDKEPSPEVVTVDLDLDDIADLELGDVKTPDQLDDAALALGSDIHDLPPDGSDDRIPPPGSVDAVLLAYLRDLDSTQDDSPPSPSDATPVGIEPEVTKPERPKRR